VNHIRLLAKTIGWAGAVSLLSLLAAWTAISCLLAHETRLAVVFSVSAFLLDILDGFLARKLGTDSAFGRNLDSMVDAVNYSLVAALATQLVLLPNSVLGFVVAFLILACGILRLVWFNVNGFATEGDKLYYTGVVTPHLTLAVTAIYVANHFVNLNEWIIAGILTVLALAQLSTIRTLKTGVLIFWIPASVAIAVGAWIWL